jgi:hypothetical protein
MPGASFPLIENQAKLEIVTRASLDTEHKLDHLVCNLGLDSEIREEFEAESQACFSTLGRDDEGVTCGPGPVS